MDTNLLAQLVAALTQKVGSQPASVTITVLVLAALAPTLVSVAAFFQTRTHGKEITDLKVHVNSRMDELLRRTGESARAAGAAEQQATQSVAVAENGSKFTSEQVKVILDAIHNQSNK